MRLPNGYGSVFKTNRRNPWRAVTAAPERKHVGYFATKKEAVKALAEYETPNAMTVKQVYDKWSAEKFPTIAKPGDYERAFNRMKGIWDSPMASLRLDDLEKVFSQNYTDNCKYIMKVVLNQMYEWAMKHDVVQKNYARYVDARLGKPKKKRSPFTQEEIDKLFADFSETAQMILVSIYSGWRPSELLSYVIEGDVMKGGMKTDAGKDRIVPIHPLIKPFVKEYRMPYSTYFLAFKNLMKELGMEHTPHEARHTFISMAKEQELNDDIIKLIVGHARKDVTEVVYTHRTLDALKRTMERVKWE